MQRKRARRIRYRPAQCRNRTLRHPRAAGQGARRGGRFRVANPRRFRIAQAVLAGIALVALGLSASAIAGSVHTAMLNRSLAATRTVGMAAPEVEIAAPPLGSEEVDETIREPSPFGELSAMGLPDGTPIATPAAITADASAPSGVFRRTDLEVLADMRALLDRNPDTVGWLDIDRTINCPVVYRDNAYYLNHDFDGAQSASGTLFLDENAPLTAGTQNLLIHGHSMYDGSMFGLLTHYRKLSFLTKHPLIAFTTLWEKESYAVFAVLMVSSDAQDANYFNYFNHPTFESDAAFDGYIQALKGRSMFDIPVDVKPTDALLTLSTCMDDDRLVVVARRLRANETRDALVSAVESSI